MPGRNLGTAEQVVALSNSDLSPLLEKYGIHDGHAQHRSGLERTVFRVFETERPNELEAFTQGVGVASWNELRIVPIPRLADNVVPEVERLDGLD